MELLLKQGAYHQLNLGAGEGDEVKPDDFAEEQAYLDRSIEDILANAKTRSTDSKEKSNGSSFSKASFVAEEQRGTQQVGWDDPEFWNKLLPKGAGNDADDALALLAAGRGKRKVRKQVNYCEEEIEAQRAVLRRLARQHKAAGSKMPGYLAEDSGEESFLPQEQRLGNRARLEVIRTM